VVSHRGPPEIARSAVLVAVVDGVSAAMVIQTDQARA